MEAEETEVVPMLDLAASRFDENRPSLPVTRVTRLAEVRRRFPFPLTRERAESRFDQEIGRQGRRAEREEEDWTSVARGCFSVVYATRIFYLARKSRRDRKKRIAAHPRACARGHVQAFRFNASTRWTYVLIFIVYMPRIFFLSTNASLVRAPASVLLAGCVS